MSDPLASRPTDSILIAASCSTRWFDAAQSELWLCPAGLLRRSIGIWATVRHGTRQTVDPTNRPRRTFSQDEIARAAAVRQRNGWIPWSQILRAVLIEGVTDCALHLELADGRRVKFMWLRIDGGQDLLDEQLKRTIPGYQGLRRSRGRRLFGGFRPTPPAPTGTPSPGDWPITVVVRWRDPGWNVRDARWLGYLALAMVWAAGSEVVLERRLHVGFLMVVALIVGAEGWRWLRRRPVHAELSLEPERLRFRDLAAQTPVAELRREQAGDLSAADTGLDWRERVVILTDDRGREVLHARAGQASVSFLDAATAPEAWWRAVMPDGTTPQTPPSEASVAALLAAWWPRPERRWSIRTEIGARVPWADAQLRDYAAWNRSQGRRNAFLFAGLLTMFYGVSLALFGPWPAPSLIEIGLPGLIGIVVLLRAAR